MGLNRRLELVPVSVFQLQLIKVSLVVIRVAEGISRAADSPIRALRAQQNISVTLKTIEDNCGLTWMVGLPSFARLHEEVPPEYPPPLLQAQLKPKMS